MEIGKMYVQKHNDEHIYCTPTKQLKNGGFSGLIFRHYNAQFSGKAKLGSLTNWFPVPVLVSTPPPQVIAKFNLAI